MTKCSVVVAHRHPSCTVVIFGAVTQVGMAGIAIIKQCIFTLQAKILPFHEEFIVCIEQFVSENDEDVQNVCLGLSQFGAVAVAIGSGYNKYIQTTVRHVQSVAQVLCV